MAHRMTTAQFTETVRALVEAEDEAAVIGGDPAKQAVADWLREAVRDAPALSSSQRANVRSILRGARRNVA